MDHSLRYRPKGAQASSVRLDPFFEFPDKIVKCRMDLFLLWLRDLRSREYPNTPARITFVLTSTVNLKVNSSQLLSGFVQIGKGMKEKPIGEHGGERGFVGRLKIPGFGMIVSLPLSCREVAFVPADLLHHFEEAGGVETERRVNTVRCRATCTPLGRRVATYRNSPSRYREWIGRLSTARAASLKASERVGWAWTVRAISSALPPYSM